MKRLMRVGALVAVLVLLTAACGSDGGNGGSAEPADERTGADGGDETGDAAPDDDDGGVAAGGSGGGQLELDGETILFERTTCWLEEQEAAGGGTILLVGQGFGTHADGRSVSFDFTRFDEDTMFAGDDISVTIGHYEDPDSEYYLVRLDIGGVSQEGSTLRASDLTLTDDDGDEQVAASFILEC